MNWWSSSLFYYFLDEPPPTTPILSNGPILINGLIIEAMKSNKVMVIVGPTASGKSALAVRLAREFNGEVISADSRQVYKGLDVGTGKVTKKEMGSVPHHLLNVASPRHTFTVVRYQKLAGRAIRSILVKGKLPILCGGTGLYLDAVIYNYHLPHVPPDPKLRRRLGKEPAEKLFAKLQKLDPERAASVDAKNKRRLIRALEIIIKTSKPVPSLIRTNRRIVNFEVLKIGITLPEKALKGKIWARLSRWLEMGLVAEVKKLRRGGLSWKQLENFGLVYREVSRYLQKLITEEEMNGTLRKKLWHYAKRQMTWFKRDKEIRWVRNAKEAEKLVRDFV